MAQSKQRSEPRQSDWEVVSYVTLEGGIVVMVERAISYTSEGHRFTVLLDLGSGLGRTPDFLSTLYRTFSGIVERHTSSKLASPSGKPPTLSE